MDTKKLLQQYDRLKTARSPWDLLWQEIALYVVPRKYPGMAGSVIPVGTEVESRLFDITAIDAHQTNAAGCLAWITPQSAPWFTYSPPSSLKDDSAKRWLAKCTDVARDELSRSTFYFAAHEFFLDRSAFGVGCVYAERDTEGKLFFECWPVGTFVIERDHRGKVVKVIREFRLTAEDAVNKFGAENVSEKVRKAAADGGTKAMEESTYLHFIVPRLKEQQKDESVALQQRMPWACYYVERDKQTLCRESGYQQMPVFVSSYLEWGTGMGGGYGWSPAFAALPEARQLNFLQKNMDALAELAAFPPWLIPEELEGEVDGNAGGATYFSKEISTDRMPRQLEHRGRYDVGKDRVLERQNAIKRVFHVDMFQMLTQMEKPGQMTAFEVAERAAEKLVPFSPTFSRVSSEFCEPLLQWLFDDLLLAGKFGDLQQIPATLQIQMTGGVFVVPPTIQFNSRMALELKRLPTLGLWRTLQLAQSISAAQQSVAIFDHVDWGEGLRDAAITEGLNADLIVPKAKVQELQQARAQAQMQMEQMAAAEAMAGAAGKLGSIKADSMIGQQLQAA